MPLLDLLRWYATAPTVFDFRPLGIDAVVSMKWIMLLYASVTVVWIVLWARCRREGRRDRMKALLVIFWLSILAPCSWFVIFKGHSEVHRTLAAIIWCMPFMIYGMALVGSSLDAFIDRRTEENVCPA